MNSYRELDKPKEIILSPEVHEAVVLLAKKKKQEESFAKNQNFFDMKYKKKNLETFKNAFNDAIFAVIKDPNSFVTSHRQEEKQLGEKYTHFTASLVFTEKDSELLNLTKRKEIPVGVETEFQHVIYPFLAEFEKLGYFRFRTQQESMQGNSRVTGFWPFWTTTYYHISFSVMIFPKENFSEFVNIVNSMK